MTIKYRHFRLIERNLFGKPTICNMGGFTFAYVEDGDQCLVAVAQCSKNDNFCRKTGRDLAAVRLATPMKVSQSEVNRFIKHDEQCTFEEQLAFAKRIDKFFGTSLSKWA